MQLHLGYFEHFRGPDTILFCGDEDGLQRLAGVLRCLENPNAEPVNLHLLPFVHIHGEISLAAHPVDRELGIRRLSDTDLVPETALDFSEIFRRGGKNRGDE